MQAVQLQYRKPAVQAVQRWLQSLTSSQQSQAQTQSQMLMHVQLQAQLRMWAQTRMIAARH